MEAGVQSKAGRAAAVPWHIVALVAGIFSSAIGGPWDISWHMTIGRDSFWTPAHLLIQAGGLIAGLSSGYVALRTTFAGTPAQRAASVSFWGFRAPLGAWVCVWGCGAMLASAPFDNWWHNAYGLDVQIVSPPHMVLALGIVAVTLGALLLTLARQNQSVEVLLAERKSTSISTWVRSRERSSNIWRAARTLGTASRKYTTRRAGSMLMRRISIVCCTAVEISCASWTVMRSGMGTASDITGMISVRFWAVSRATVSLKWFMASGKRPCSRAMRPN